MPVDRAAEVARRREEAGKHKKLALERKLKEKEEKRGRGPLAVLTANKRAAAKSAGSEELAEDEVRLEREIEDLLCKMRAPDVSAAKQFALKKTLAVCRAELLKLNRKAEAARAQMVRAAVRCGA